MFSITTWAFGNFHPNWLIAFAFDAVVFCTCFIISGHFHPGGPKTNKMVEEVYFLTIGFVLLHLASVCFVRFICIKTFIN